MWYNMNENGDAEHIFGDSAKSLTSFLKEFQPPVVLFYQRDSKGISRALWLTPIMSSALVGLWARPDARGRDVITFCREVFNSVFLYTRTLLCVIRRASVMQTSKWFGWRELGTIPSIYNGQAGTVFYLTKDLFEEQKNG
jgi:hypothetical protein